MQFGTAMIPGRGHPRAPRGSPRGSTAGRRRSIRNALELSMHTVPCACDDRRQERARRRWRPPRRTRRRRRRPRRPRARAPRTSRPANGTVRPALRADASGTNVIHREPRAPRGSASSPGRPRRSRRSPRPSCRSPYRRPRVHPGATRLGHVQAEARRGSTCTARSPSARRITHETRIGEVEIISMLMPSVGEHVEHVGGHARMRLHPRADERDLRDVVVHREPRAPRSRRSALERRPAAAGGRRAAP